MRGKRLILSGFVLKKTLRKPSNHPLVRYATTIQYEEFQAEVIEMARRFLMDWLGIALASPSRAPSAAAIDDTIFSFFLSDIGYLPFDSNFTRVDVSRHIGTNGSLLT